MTDTHQYTNTHTNISFLTNQIGSECSFKLFLLLPKIKDAGKNGILMLRLSNTAMLACQICRLWATFGMWNIKRGLCQVRSHGTFWWPALLFTALSAPFSLVLRVFLRLSARQLRCQLCRLHRFGFCLQFWHERLPWLGSPPTPLPFEWQLKDRPVLCLTFTRWVQVK